MTRRTACGGGRERERARKDGAERKNAKKSGAGGSAMTKEPYQYSSCSHGSVRLHGVVLQNRVGIPMKRGR